MFHKLWWATNGLDGACAMAQTKARHAARVPARLGAKAGCTRPWSGVGRLASVGKSWPPRAGRPHVTSGADALHKRIGALDVASFCCERECANRVFLPPPPPPSPVCANRFFCRRSSMKHGARRHALERARERGGSWWV